MHIYINLKIVFSLQKFIEITGEPKKEIIMRQCIFTIPMLLQLVHKGAGHSILEARNLFYSAVCYNLLGKLAINPSSPHYY